MRLFDFCFWLKCHIKCSRRHHCKRTKHYLWVSCDPRRLDMVSSKFCRRSRTFCTVLFLWDSGSVEKQNAKKKAHKTFRDKSKFCNKPFKCLLFYLWENVYVHAHNRFCRCCSGLDNLCLAVTGVLSTSTQQTCVHLIRQTNFTPWTPAPW